MQRLYTFVYSYPIDDDDDDDNNNNNNVRLIVLDSAVSE
jgi:hypothetical protein